MCKLWDKLTIVSGPSRAEEKHKTKSRVRTVINGTQFATLHSNYRMCYFTVYTPNYRLYKSTLKLQNVLLYSLHSKLQIVQIYTQITECATFYYDNLLIFSTCCRLSCTVYFISLCYVYWPFYHEKTKFRCYCNSW